MADADAAAGVTDDDDEVIDEKRLRGIAASYHRLLCTNGDIDAWWHEWHSVTRMKVIWIAKNTDMFDHIVDSLPEEDYAIRDTETYGAIVVLTDLMEKAYDDVDDTIFLPYTRRVTQHLTRVLGIPAMYSKITLARMLVNLLFMLSRTTSGQREILAATPDTVKLLTDILDMQLSNQQTHAAYTQDIIDLLVDTQAQGRIKACRKSG